ncbi:MAG TPA: hypothetical protein VF146_04035 [Bryobacteraceae bacterium]
MSRLETSSRRGRKPETGDREAAPAEAKSGKWFYIASLALTALFLIGLFSTQIADTDFWWHLKTGQYIVQRHSLPVPDPFSFSTARNPPADAGEQRVQHFNLTHEWLAQALLYCVYWAAGFPGIILVRAGLLAAFCALAGLLAGRRSGNFYIGVGAALAAASVAVNFTADRPALFTFFMAALFVVLLDSGRFLWALPPLALLWANCHGGFFLGGIVLGAYCGASLLPRAAITNRRTLWMAAGSSIALSGLNPNGFGVIATLVRYRQSAMTANLIEWHPPYLWGPPYAFDVLLYLSAAALLYSWRQVRWQDWALFAAFGAASLAAFRNIPLIAFFAPVVIASYFPVRLRLPRIAGWMVPAALTGALVFGIGSGSFFQLRAAEWKFPAGAAGFVLQNHVAGPLFNTWEDGGYLIWRLWPEQRVFIDGRALSEASNRDYREILYNLGSDVGHLTGPRAELLQRYGIQTVVTNTFEYVTGAMYPLALALADSPDWQLVYDDSHSLVFTRAPQPDATAVPAKLGHVLSHMDTECADYIQHDPRLPLCARTMGRYWAEGAHWDRAYRMLSLYLAHKPRPDPEAERAFQRLLRVGR